MMYGDRMLSVAHCGNFIFNMPLAPVMMLAVRVPDCANSMMAVHACSTVNWCKSNVACANGASGCFGMRVDKCKSVRTARRVAASSGVYSRPIICAISWSVNCFMHKIIKTIFKKANVWFFWDFVIKKTSNLNGGLDSTLIPINF